jgi:hypothetical protein
MGSDPCGFCKRELVGEGQGCRRVHTDGAPRSTASSKRPGVPPAWRWVEPRNARSST